MEAMHTVITERSPKEKHMRNLLAPLLFAFTLLCQTSMSEAGILMQIPGVQGESKVPNHTGWIDLESVNWGHGETPPGTPVKIQFARVTGTKHSDSVSATLALFGASGQLIKDVKIEFTSSVGDSIVVISRIKLTNARLTTYQASAHDSSLPIESLSFSFDSITWINFKISPQGQQLPGSAACWDLAGNKPCTPTF